MSAEPRCRRILRAASVALPVLLAGALGAGPARADEFKWDISGKIESDLRFRLQDQNVGDYYDHAELAAGIDRSQNLVSVKFKASYGRFAGVIAADVYLNAVATKVQAFGDLASYNAVSPFSFEPQAIYVEGKGIFLKGLDLRLGNQLVAWGAADQFNPTNNLNSDDLRDPLLFGKQVPNFMVKADYWITKTFSLSGVLVPIFRPALLPASATLGSVDIQRMPFTGTIFRNHIESQFGFAAASGYPTIVEKITPVLPNPAADNMQFAYRMAGTIGEQDISLSYYLGRTDFPQPFSNYTHESDKKQCDPQAPTKCIMGTLRTDVLLGYPRMHVFGLNMAGEFNPFKKISEKIQGIGYRLEAALIVPTRTTIQLTQGALPGVLQPTAGEYDYDGDGKPGGPQPAVLEQTPFAKWTIGLDYSFGEHVYANAMWVHGLADEFGAGDFFHTGWTVRQSGIGTNTINGNQVPLSAPQISSQCVNVSKPVLGGASCVTETLAPKLGDYLVVGADFKFLDDAGLLRVFTVWDLNGVYKSAWSNEIVHNGVLDPSLVTCPPGASARSCHAQGPVLTHYPLTSADGFSASIYPELSYNFGNGLQLSAGALLLIGKSYTKFGDPATGGSIAFTRGRFSF